MTDREMLELAAKAAEVTGGWGEKIDYHNGAVDLRDIWILESDDFAPWNPLTDDGDALRLAVKLRLVITVGARNMEARRWTGGDGGMEPMHWQVVAQGGDPYAATRRAITRAAAEIGKDMP